MKDEALRCALLCNEVYYNIKNIENTGMATWYYCAQSNTLCFRGSDDRTDWLFNTSFETWIYLNANGHRGFFDIYRSAERYIKQLLDALPEDRRRTITLTGHSLGGALASICALHMWYSYRIAPMIYIFGCPKVFVGDQINVQQALLRCSRFINRYDIIPHMPLGIYYGYKHYGKEYWLKKPNIPFLPILGGALAIKKLWIDDHFIKSYAEALND